MDPSQTTRSGRIIRDTQWYAEGMKQQDSDIIAWEILLSQDKCEDHPIASCQYEIQREMEDLGSFAASTNPYIMYLHEAMKAPDCNQFHKAMDKELDENIS